MRGCYLPQADKGVGWHVLKVPKAVCPGPLFGQHDLGGSFGPCCIQMGSPASKFPHIMSCSTPKTRPMSRSPHRVAMPYLQRQANYHAEGRQMLCCQGGSAEEGLLVLAIQVFLTLKGQMGSVAHMMSGSSSSCSRSSRIIVTDPRLVPWSTV